MVLRGAIRWFMENKAVSILSVLLFSFIVATIALAVEKVHKEDELALCEKRLSDLTSTTKPPPTPTTEAPTTVAPPDPSYYRLPSNIKPTAYTLRLQPDLDTAKFAGRVEILATVEGSASEVILHSAEIEIKTIQIVSTVTGAQNIKSEHKLVDDSREFLIITPETSLNAGEYKISIEYSGTLDGIVGFYSSSVDENTKIATSKFEPTYARQAFPCFDEPAMKAKFTVELVRPLKYFTLSNMNVKDKDVDFPGNTDLKIDRFEQSVEMSTYLACFIVCDFDVLKETVVSVVGNDFPFNVYATKPQLEKARFSLDIGKKVTEYYIDYFSLSYPLPKLDMIAIPDFVSGAMEHWGLVTFRETNMLYDKETTSPSNMQNIARVVAHEISHMWFGNLVTMKWWNELWLNEGFASYMQYKALEAIKPEWKTLDQFSAANTHSVLALDATLSSHPIVQTVNTPDEITAIFDTISYNKGAAVLRMLEGFVGEDNFKLGVSNYLKLYQYQNTVSQDLWDELSAIFEPNNKGRNLTYIMDTWTRQMGLPIVTVAVKNTNTYTLTQKRFLADPETKPESPSAYNDRWYIPITYTTDKGLSKEMVWFPDNEDSVDFTIPAGEKLLKLNNGQIGYYRVQYPDDMWITIQNDLMALSTTKLSITDRAHILNDVFSLAEASEVKFDIALKISQYLKNEKEYVPWAVASSLFSSLKRIFSNSIGFMHFKGYVKTLIKDVYEYVSWNDGDDDLHTKRLLRSVILNLACSVGEEDCLSNARDRFKNWIDDPAANKIDPNIKSTVYYYGIETNGEVEWLKLWDLYLAESDAQEKSKFMQALAASKDPMLLKRYLTLAWEEKNVRSQDYFTVLQYISANPVGTSLVWDFFREDWEKIVTRFTLNSRVLGTTVPAITRSFATVYKLKEVETFFEMYPNAGAGAAAREQTKENIKNNISWLTKHEETVRKWLEALP